MSGEGVCVAAMTTPGGLGAFLHGPAGEYNDRVVPLGQAVGTDDTALVENIRSTDDELAKVSILRHALEAAVDPDRAEPAREVARIARCA